MLQSTSSGSFFYFDEASFLPVQKKASEGNLDAIQLFANMARFNALYMITRAGSGHIGSSFSSLDLVSWIYLQGLRSSEDIYFSSKGHDAPGLYAVLTALGKLDFSLVHALRRLGGLPGHPDILTQCIPCNTGSLGMGVSKAKGFVFANRLANKQGQMFVLTGDGELQEGQFWESLQGAVTHRMGEITVIVDHNKLQSDTYVKDTGDLGDLEAKFKAYGWEVARCDGHDLTAIHEHLEKFLTIKDRPKVLIADTLKGRGVSFMEPSAMEQDQIYYKFHSGAPTVEVYRKAAEELYETIQQQAVRLKLAVGEPVETQGQGVPPGKRERLIPFYSEAILEEAEKNQQLLALDADLVLDTGLIPFKEKYPRRFFEFGIAEQDMVSAASAMALKGYLPVVHSFACFLTTRPNEQIYNAATERTKIIYVGSLAGLTPSGPGHSHQSVRDINCMSAMPNLLAIEPSCPAAVKPLISWAVNETKKSVYVRFVSAPTEVSFPWLSSNLQLGQGISILGQAKSQVVIFAYGPVMLSEAYQAAQSLTKEGINVLLIDMPWLNYIDGDWLKTVISETSLVVSIDNHYQIGGQGDRIASTILEHDIHSSFLHLYVDEIPECGTNDEVLRKHALDAASIKQRILRRLNGTH